MVNKSYLSYDSEELNGKARQSSASNSSSFFTLPRILSNGRKSRHRKVHSFQKLQSSVPSGLNDETCTDDVDNVRRNNGKEKDEEDEDKSRRTYFKNYNHQDLVNSKIANGNSKNNNFISRLMKHFSTHSSSTQLNGYNRKQNEYTNLRSRLKSTNHLDDIFSCSSSSSSSRVFTICGIKNHGNTCFMNAILQCLSNTDLLAEYFLTNRYKFDLFKHSEINGKRFSSRAEVTEQCALLFKSLWSNSYTFEISNKFKLLVSKYGKQYEGSEQHDAQEFLLWLLDRFHEDLNIAAKKRFKKIRVIFTFICSYFVFAEKFCFKSLPLIQFKLKQSHLLSLK